jgi:transcriptional regulator with XRE-family HTH domain
MNSVRGVPIKIERKAHGWTIREMARKLRDAAEDPGGVPYDLDSLVHNIYRWESGRRGGISERYRVLYCKIFRCNEFELFGIGQPESEVPGTARTDTPAGRSSLRRARKAAGFTQESLAEKIGVDRTTPIRWERGEAEPSPHLRPKLAKALGISLCDLDELLWIDDEPLTRQTDRVVEDEQYYDVDSDQHVRTPNLILRRIREVERNETRSEFAQAMAGVARELGESVEPSEQYVARLEDGDIRYPHPPYRRVLMELCERSMADLGFARPQIPHNPATIEPDNVREDEEEMERRQLLESLAVLGVTISPVSQALDTMQTTFGGAFGYHECGHLDEWEETIWEYGYSYLATSPVKLIPDLAADLVALRSIVTRIPRTDSKYCDWCRLAGILSGLMAKSLSNLGNNRGARQWWSIAQHVADNSADLSLRLWVRGERIIHGLYENRPAQILLRQAQAATELAQDYACPGLAHIRTGKAQVAALCGDYRSAEEELRLAEDILNRLPTTLTIDTSSVFAWGERRLRYTETWIYSYQGQGDKTDGAALRALQLYPETNTRSPAQIRLMQAFARIQCGDIAEGIRHAQIAYEPLADSQSTIMVDELARRVLSSVPNESWGRADVAAYRELVQSTSHKGIES